MNTSAMSSNFQLPSSILSYLMRLKIEYDQSEDRLLSQIVTSKVYVRKGTKEHDVTRDLRTRIYGHDVSSHIMHES